MSIFFVEAVLFPWPSLCSDFFFAHPLLRDMDTFHEFCIDEVIVMVSYGCLLLRGFEVIFFELWF